MIRYRQLLPMVLSLILLTGSFATHAIDALEFTSQEQELRYQTLVRELRCLVCQNQNLADSDAPLARDLRLEIFDLIQAGQTDTEIKQFLTDRYGDFVLYKPPLKPETWVLWFGPIILLMIGFLLARRWWRRLPVEVPKTTGSPEQNPDHRNDGEFS